MSGCLVLLVFPALMAYAAASDLTTMTIGNWISLALMASFLVMSALLGLDWHDILMQHLLCGVGVLVLTFILYSLGWIGGGDAKLAAAIAVWTGWDHLGEFALEASVFGGGLTLLIIGLRRCPLPRPALGAVWILRLHDADNGVPYGIALAAAGLVLYPQTQIWSSAT